MGIKMFFTIVYLFDEFFLHLIAQNNINFNFLLYIVRNSLIVFFIIKVIDILIKNIKSKRIIFLFLILFMQIIFITYICINNTFSVFFTFEYIIKMSHTIATVFTNDAFFSIKNNIVYIFILFIPILIYILLNKKFNFKILKSKKLIVVFTILIFMTIISYPTLDIKLNLKNINYDTLVRDRGIFGAEITIKYQDLINKNSNKDFFMYNANYLKNDIHNEDINISTISQIDISDANISTNSNLNINKKNDFEFEIQNIKDFKNENNYNDINQSAIINTKKYKPNILNIDFDYLASQESNDDIKNIHLSMKKIDPTYKNEYTGIFKNKLLIQISAEAFSPYFIDKQLTPTLYELVNGSFVFDNFYTPNFGQSTIGGEFANLTGLLPMWFNGITSAIKTKNNNLLFTFQNMTHKMTNNKSVAYHNGRYEVYDRPELYKTWGFDEYIANGSGLEKLPKIDEHKYFYNDSGLIDLVFEDYIKEQKENMSKGMPIKHFYFMTISGHMPYNFDKTVTKFYKKIVDLNFDGKPEEIKAYIATQLELEYALSHMIEILKRNQMIENVVICMANDHYPYALTDVNGVDLYKEFANFDYKKNTMPYYKSALIIYSTDIKEVHIDTPCSSIDITPTLLNLFGYDYDSRMITGRDIMDMSYKKNKFTTNLPIVYFPLFSDLNFITVDDENDINFKNFALEVSRFKKNLSIAIQKHDYYKYIKEYIK